MMDWRGFALALVFALLIAAATYGCASETGRFQWGETTDAPYGWSAMCARDPEAFSCP